MRLCARCRNNHKIMPSVSFIDSLSSRKWLDYSCGFDKYSDMDFIIVVDPIFYDEIIAQRRLLGGTPGHLLHAFTKEHVREMVAYTAVA